MKQYNIYSPNNWPFNYLRAKNAGASGFIGILHDFMDCHYFHEDYTDIVNVGGYMELPALWVSKKDGEKLKAAVKSNVVSKGSLHVKTVYELKEYLLCKEAQYRIYFSPYMEVFTYLSFQIFCRMDCDGSFSVSVQIGFVDSPAVLLATAP